MEMTYRFQTNGEQLEGSIESPMGTTPIEKGTITADKKISFELNFRGMQVPYTGELTPANELVLTNPRGQMTLTRAVGTDAQVAPLGSRPPAGGFGSAPAQTIG